MGIVIAFIIIVAGYVGYHASQNVPLEGEAHSILPELQIHSLENLQIIPLKSDQTISS